MNPIHFIRDNNGDRVFYTQFFLSFNYCSRPLSHVSDGVDALDYEEVTLSQGLDYEDVSFPPPSSISLGQTKEVPANDR